MAREKTIGHVPSIIHRYAIVFDKLYPARILNWNTYASDPINRKTNVRGINSSTNYNFLQSSILTLTTGNSDFAECPRHSAKPQIHSAKTLLSVTLGEFSTGKQMFAECQISGTRQRVCRVSKNTRRSSTLGEKGVNGVHGNGEFAECQTEDTRQTSSTFPSAKPPTLGKDGSPRTILLCFCRVLKPIHSVNIYLFIECFNFNTRQTLHTRQKIARKIETGLFAEC